MKNLFLTLPALLLINFASGQIYFDPATSAATAAHASIIDRQLSSSSEKLTLLRRAQLTVTGQLAVANTLQSQIYQGLSEVSCVMRSLLSVKEIYETSIDVIEDLEKVGKLGRKNPALLLFAESAAREIKTRASLLSTQVGSFVLKGGKDNLMDSGERAKLLNAILGQLLLLRGLSYGMYRSMYWADQRGILRSINPYAGFINIDKRIAEEVILKTKMFKP